MKKLLILSGKGGTGKTTTAAAFIKFSKAKAFADCDVDAPNLHIVSSFDAATQKSVYHGSEKAVIDKEKCINCGLCMEKCRFNSIISFDTHYGVNEYACEGCGVCEFICPAEAIKMSPDVSGDLELFKNDSATFSTAKLRMGRGNSGKLVSEVKAELYKNVEKAELCIIDGSPGIGCPVIASINGVDLVLIVAEPSRSGISDMERIIQTARGLGVKISVCVNKSDSSTVHANEIEDFCKANEIHFSGHIPMDKEVPKAVNAGISIADVDCKARDALLSVYENVIGII